MAAHIFCPSCGTKNEFTNGRRPNFCSGCGYNFSSLAAFGGDRSVIPQREQSNVNSGPAVDIDYTNDGSGGGRTPQLSQADVDVVGDGGKVIRDSKTNTFRVVDANRMTMADFYANPVPPVEARHAMSIEVKGARKQVKQAFDSYKEQAGGNGLKRVEIGKSASNDSETYE